MLDDDALEQICHVLASIGGGLEEVEDLFPFDHDDGVAFVVEERDDSILMDAVGFAFELINPRGQLPVDPDNKAGDLRQLWRDDTQFD